MEQKKTNILAIVALCIGIFGWVSGFMFLAWAYTDVEYMSGLIIVSLSGILAVACGIKTLLQIKKGLARGRWMAIVGIIFGILDFIGWNLMLTILYLQSLD